MFLVNSCLGRFSAAASLQHPFSRSYGVNLPIRGQLAEFLNNPSPVGLRIFFLPTCVGLRYGHLRYTRSFSRLSSSQTSVLYFPRSLPEPTPGSDLQKVSLRLNLSGRNLYRLCIGYAFRPHLSSRLTWSGRTFLQKPEVSGHADSHCIRATHSGILTSVNSTAAYATVSPLTQRSPTPHLTVQPKLRFVS